MANDSEFKVKADDKTKAAFEAVDKRLKSTEGKTDSLGKSMGKMSGQTKTLVTNFAKVGGALLGLTAGANVLSKALDTTAEFETLNAMLITATGSVENAGVEFEKLNNFATTTPFILNEVIGSFVKLKNLGLDPSERALKSYGNTASATGKSLDQLIEAVADASVGEFERLKEFGIKARSQGDNVSFTFRGVETTVEKSSTQIQNYLLKLGETEFAGAMERQADDLTVRFSNLEAATDKLLVKFSESTGLTLAAKQAASGMTNLFNTLAGGHRPIDSIKQEIGALTARLGSAGDHIQNQLIAKISVLTVELNKAQAAIGGVGAAGAPGDKGPTDAQIEVENAKNAELLALAAEFQARDNALAIMHGDNKLIAVQEGLDQEAHLKRQGYAQMLLDHEAYIDASTDAELNANEQANAVLLASKQSLYSNLLALGHAAAGDNQKLQKLMFLISRGASAATIYTKGFEEAAKIRAAYAMIPGGQAISEPLAAKAIALGTTNAGIVMGTGLIQAAREHGGPVSAGSLYKVNDGAGNPMEVFEPNVSGNIISNKNINRGGDTIINLNVSTESDATRDDWADRNINRIAMGVLSVIAES